MKVCSNCHGHVTKMVGMPIYGKKPLPLLGHCLTQGHSDVYFQTYSQAAGHIKVKCFVEPL